MDGLSFPLFCLKNVTDDWIVYLEFRINGGFHKFATSVRLKIAPTRTQPIAGGRVARITLFCVVV